MGERYRLKHLVATGGMAEVYLGVAQGAEGFEKQVVIKRIHPHLAADRAVVAMFLAEARLARHLHHQNIVEVLDVGTSPDGLYLVMELVDGWSLEEIQNQCIARRVRVPAPLAGYLALQVVAGLAHAYGRTDGGKRLLVAHRDISPSNVLVSTEGEVKVADFGIAKLETASAGTEPGTFKGKLGYAAPEVLRAEPATAAADQFGLGVVLYELLAGQHPFGDCQNLMGYVEALGSAPPPLPPACGALGGIVLRLLAKTPAGRFSGAEELSRVLAAYLASCGVPTSSSELARFTRGLELAPSFGQRPGSSVQTGGRSFSLELPAGSVAFEPDPNWQPTGPGLDASGNLSSTSSGGSAPLPVQPPAPARPARAQELISSVAEDPGPPAPSPARADEPLELARAPRSRHAGEEAGPIDEGEAPRGRSSFWKVAVLSCLVLGGGAAAVYFLPPHFDSIKAALGLSAPVRKPMLYLDSYPPGAVVQITGVPVGTTPYIQENLYPAGAAIEFQLLLKGYKPAKGSFMGGEGAERLLKLERR